MDNLKIVAFGDEYAYLKIFDISYGGYSQIRSKNGVCGKWESRVAMKESQNFVIMII